MSDGGFDARSDGFDCVLDDGTSLSALGMGGESFSFDWPSADSGKDTGSEGFDAGFDGKDARSDGFDCVLDGVGTS